METVEELINEMLTINPETQLASWEDTINTRRIVTQFMVNMGKRLYAAHKREMAAHKRALADALDTGAFVEATRKSESVTDCNALNGAKCREALEWCRDFMRDIYDGKEGVKFSAYDIERIDSALSAPPRNCDKCLTPKDAMLAHLEEVYEGEKVEFGDYEWCEFGKWLFAEAKGEQE